MGAMPQPERPVKTFLELLRRDLAVLSGFFKEDNGNLSSMRLVTIFTVCVLVPGFLVACVFVKELRELATHMFTFAFSVLGLKTAQKHLETDTPP